MYYSWTRDWPKQSVANGCASDWPYDRSSPVAIQPRRHGLRNTVMVLSAGEDKWCVEQVNLHDATAVCASVVCPSVLAHCLPSVPRSLGRPRASWPLAAAAGGRTIHHNHDRCRRGDGQDGQRQPTRSPGAWLAVGRPMQALTGRHAKMRGRMIVFWDGREGALRKGPCSRSNLAHSSFCAIQNI